MPFNGTMTSKNTFNLIDATFQHVYDKESEYGLLWEPRVDEILETHANGGYDAESLEADGLSEIDSFSFLGISIPLIENQLVFDNTYVKLLFKI